MQLNVVCVRLSLIIYFHDSYGVRHIITANILYLPLTIIVPHWKLNLSPPDSLALSKTFPNNNLFRILTSSIYLMVMTERVNIFLPLREQCFKLMHSAESAALSICNNVLHAFANLVALYIFSHIQHIGQFWDWWNDI